MKNAMVNNLLKIAPNALRDLHDVLGMDFCAPYGVEYTRGNYTVNKVAKMAAMNGYGPGDLLVILTRNANKCWYSQTFKLVTVEDDGKIEIDYRIPYRAGGGGLDTYFRKGDFESDRKSEKAESYILWQRREYLKIPDKKSIDKTARYKLIKADYWYANADYKYIHRLTLKQIGEQGKQLSYKIDRYSVDNCKRIPETESDVIDKSGYFVDERRAELKHRVAEIRAEREKAAFNATDNADKVTDIANRIAARKAELIQQLTDANTSAELDKVGQKLIKFRGLAWTMYEFEVFRERVANKTFKSISDCDYDYHYILARLEKSEED